eukprot:scaffold7744_cov38-Phaeocystis_antarctica.AAC.2
MGTPFMTGRSTQSFGRWTSVSDSRTDGEYAMLLKYCASSRLSSSSEMLYLSCTRGGHSFGERCPSPMKSATARHATCSCSPVHQLTVRCGRIGCARRRRCHLASTSSMYHRMLCASDIFAQGAEREHALPLCARHLVLAHEAADRVKARPNDADKAHPRLQLRGQRLEQPEIDMVPQVNHGFTGTSLQGHVRDQHGADQARGMSDAPGRHVFVPRLEPVA